MFFFSRIFVFLVSLLFSLLYSYEIGLQSRAFFTLVATVNLLLTGLTVTGISLHSRLQESKHGTDFNVAPFFGAITVIAILNTTVSTLILLAYGHSLSINLPSNLVVTCATYSFFASLMFGLHEGLVLLRRIGLVSVLDISVILMQIILYYFFKYLDVISPLVCVFLAFIFSYAFSSFSILLVLVTSFSFSATSLFQDIKQVFSKSQKSYLVSVSENIGDRLEKLALGFISGSSILAQYSVAMTPLGIFRLIADSESKLRLVRRRLVRVSPKSLYFSIITLLSIFSTIFVWGLIGLTLGSSWLLSIPVLFLISLQELLRANLMISIRNLMQLGDMVVARGNSLISIASSVFIFPSLFFLFGLDWALAANCFVIYSQTVWLKKRLSRLFV